MKGLKSKSIVCAIIVMLLFIITQLPVLATNEENVIMKKADKEFIIYYKDICNSEFQFAFSVTDETKQEDLNFTNSVKDQIGQGELNVAYIDEILYSQYFNTSTSAYIWIMDNDGKIVVEADKVDLLTALDDSMINEVNSITKKISIDTTKEHQTNEMINGVDTTVTTGKVVINAKENAKYYYQLVRVSDENSSYAELFELAEQIIEGISGTYNQLNITKQFYDLYSSLVPTEDDSNWTEVSNMEILQPEDTKEGDKYIVFLKEEAETTTIDSKFLVSTYQYKDEYEPEKIVIQETVKLPVTYDSIALFVILGIIIISIIVVAILKVKADKKGKE